MFGKIVLVFAILVGVSWIEAVPADYEDVFLRSENIPKCGKNELYSMSRAACQPTCQTPEPSLCIRIGMSGCVCKEGYIRNEDMVCIKKEDCTLGAVDAINKIRED